MFLPVSRISQPIQQVLFSAFSKLQSEPKRLAEAWARGNQVISAVNVPAFLGMAVVAPDFVPVVLGHKWHAAVPVLQFLSLAGVGTTLQTLNWSTVQAMGRPGVMLRFRLFSAPVTLLAFAIGLHWGVAGVAASFAVSRFVVTPVSTFITCRTLGCSPAWGVRGEALVVFLAVLMAGAVALARLGLVQVGVPAAARLAAVVPLGLAVYGGLLLVGAPNVMGELRSLARRRA
jgi:O-antigen/teichoic acid export membrane protein